MVTRNLLLLLIIPLLASCNIYKHLDAVSSDADLEEAGNSCLHDGNFECAVEHFANIANPATRKRKLCMTYLSKSGFTLSAFLNTIIQTSDSMLGDLATSLLPWSEIKHADAQAGNINCVDYSNENPSDGDAALLKTLGSFVFCAMNIAKSDQFQTTSSGGTCDVVNSSSDGVITKSDIGQASGTPTVANPGMCAEGVNACKDDTYGMSAVSVANLQAAGLNDLADAVSAIPAALRLSSTPEDLYRAGLRDRTAND